MTTETLPLNVPAEPTTPIKPSEAIRLGCLTTVYGRGEFFPGPGQACALGAMAIGLGYAGRQHDNYVPGAYAIVRAALPPQLPGFDGEMSEAFEAVWMRNDEGWSRERIADWLAEQGL